MGNGKVRGAVALGSDLAGPKWSEGECSGGAAKSPGRQDGVGVPDPEVLEKPKRRRFSAAYKARIVEQAEQCTELGEIGALLRREGLYSSQLSTWRRQYRAGALRALKDDTRGRRPSRNPVEAENERLRRKVVRLERQLAQAHTIIEFQKKFAEVLGIPLTGTEDEEGER